MGKFGWVLGVLCLVVPGIASAQAVAVTITSVTRERPRDRSGPNTAIALADCLAEDKLKVTLSLGAGYQQHPLEAWVGDGCDSRASRFGANAPCWKVYSAQPNRSVYSFEVAVRDVLSGRTGGQGSAEVPPTCVPSSRATAPQTLQLTFLLLDGAAKYVGTASMDLTYKLRPSPAPDFVFPTAVGEQLLLDFGFNSTPDRYIAGYRLFCEPTAGCAASTRLVAGAAADELEDLRCGSAEHDAQSGAATELQPSTAYNVAVATVDTYGNLSALSPPACQTTNAVAVSSPAPSEQTSTACSFAQRRAPFPLLAALGLGGLGLVRRRRSRYSRPAKIAASERSATHVTPSDAP